MKTKIKVGIEYFIKNHLLFIVISGYRRFVRFLYRTIGTIYIRNKHSDITIAEFIELTGHHSTSDLVRYFKNRKNPIFFLSDLDRGRFADFFKHYFPEYINLTIKASENILNHKFNLLGSGEVYLGGKIDWHLDFKVNHHWPLIHPRGIDIFDLNSASDVKIPWELSRCHQFIILGKAYLLSKDEKYVKEFMNQIESWITQNPYRLGINWLSTMDVAIRACNWILGWHFFKEASLIDENFAIKFIRFLYLHGVHIFNNLENKGKVISNHYISNLTGLLYLGHFFKNTQIGEKWKNFAITELSSEMNRQVNFDGMNFESSTFYHRLVLELFFYPTLLSVINDELFSGDYVETAKNIFGEDYVNKLLTMFEFILYTIKTNGRMPQIGDNDNSRLHILSCNDILDMRYLLNYAAVFFNESKFKINELGLSEEALWLFGEEGYDKWKKLRENSIYDVKSKSFSHSGIYISREKRAYVIISCMHNGQSGNGGHNHNDVLSFELSFDEKDFIVDPGTYIYCGNYKMRNLFRSTFYHNTVVIDDVEANRFKKREIFRIQDEARPKVLKWETTDNYDIFEAEHYGYERLPNPVICRRRIFFNKKNLILKIEDFIEGKGIHDYKIFFHFPPIPLKLERKSLKTEFPDLPNIVITPESKEKFKAELEEGWVSPSYGIKRRAPYLCYSGKASVPFNFITNIYFLN